MRGIEAFISEYALNLHKEYLRNKKLKYSVLEKSIPAIKGCSAYEISKLRIKGKKEIISLYIDIFCHELYFNSFGMKNQKSLLAENLYGTSASFSYYLYEECKNNAGGFIIICVDGHGKIKLVSERELFVNKTHVPMLCIDLAEHSYFTDYGFNLEKYLYNSLPYLNLSKLDTIYFNT